MNDQLEQLQSQSKVHSRSATIRDVGVLLLLPLLQRPDVDAFISMRNG